ncbi:hypothetical protein [Sphingosinithalassobacter portus]|uniref:hypothetical protein n=1 Tax=Stakelama portus TaxID=2676234 RepID=UPI000D6E793D|nr:hypothetical protein [Sphingosinithalassobacter portus]
MKPLLIGLFFLIASALPAKAQKLPVSWGMSPEEVIASVPGAKSIAHDPSRDMIGLHALVEAPYLEDGVAYRAEFYFDPSLRTLRAVNSLLIGNGTCSTVRDRLIAQYGPGQSNVDRSGSARTTQLVWDLDSGEKLVSLEISILGDFRVICRVIRISE